jgi:hypothetical protein
VLGDAGADEAADESTGGGPSPQAGERRRQGTGDDQAEAGKCNRGSHRGDGAQDGAHRAPDGAATLAPSRLGARLDPELLGAGLVRHEDADVFLAVAALEQGVDGGLGAVRVLKKPVMRAVWIMGVYSCGWEERRRRWIDHDSARARPPAHGWPWRSYMPREGSAGESPVFRKNRA